MLLNEEFKNLITVHINEENCGLLTLREDLVDYKNRGMDKVSMYKNLEEMRVGCDDRTEDILLELMDFVGGFCNPELCIF